MPASLDVCLCKCTKSFRAILSKRVCGQVKWLLLKWNALYENNHNDCLKVRTWELVIGTDSTSAETKKPIGQFQIATLRHPPNWPKKAKKFGNLCSFTSISSMVDWQNERETKQLVYTGTCTSKLINVGERRPRAIKVHLTTGYTHRHLCLSLFFFFLIFSTADKMIRYSEIHSKAGPEGKLNLTSHEH